MKRTQTQLQQARPGFPEHVYVRIRWADASALAGGIAGSPLYADWAAMLRVGEVVHEALMQQAAGDMPEWVAET